LAGYHNRGKLFIGYFADKEGAVFTSFGAELSKARVEELHAVGARERAAKVPNTGTGRRRTGSVRVALGMRLVAAGFRLLGPVAEG